MNKSVNNLILFKIYKIMAICEKISYFHLFKSIAYNFNVAIDKALNPI